MSERATIFWKSSKIDTDAARRSLPASFRYQPGTRSSAIQPIPMPSSTASFTMPTALTYPAKAYGETSAGNVDSRSRSTDNNYSQQDPSLKGARSSRNPGAQSSRNKGAASSESALIDRPIPLWILNSSFFAYRWPHAPGSARTSRHRLAQQATQHTH